MSALDAVHGIDRGGLNVDDIGALALARRLWQRGLSVIPVLRPRPGVPPGQPGDGKVTAIPWREYQTRRATESEIGRLFSEGSVNIAVITGAVSGVVVVDADSLDAVRWVTRRLPYTPWQTRTARGYHLWYGHPGVRVPNRARLETRDGRLAIDVRGDGGYVIAPGSIHGSGVEYVEAGDWSVPRDRLPSFRPDWFDRPDSRSSAGPRPRPMGEIIERARKYLASIRQPEIGHGSDNATLYAACRLVRGFELSPAEAEALLWEWAGGRPGWTREWIALKVARARRYGTEPIGALR